MAHRVVDRRELAEPHAVTEALLFPPGDLEGQPGLADAPDAGQRHKRCLSQGAGDAQDIALSADETGCATRQSGAGPSGDRRRAWRFWRRVPGIAVENPLVHLPQRRAGVDAEFIDKPFPHPAIGVECVGLAATSVLGEHQLARDALVKWVGM